MEDSIFTRIIKGEIPSYKIYEDELTIAILTIEPVHPGHTLVINKKQVEQFIDLPEEDYTALWQTVRKLGPRIRKVNNNEFLGVVIKGRDVPHAHIHLIPFNRDEGFKADADPPKESDEALKVMHERLKLTG